MNLPILVCKVASQIAIINAPLVIGGQTVSQSYMDVRPCEQIVAVMEVMPEPEPVPAIDVPPALTKTVNPWPSVMDRQRLEAESFRQILKVEQEQHRSDPSRKGKRKQKKH